MTLNPTTRLLAQSQSLQVILNVEKLETTKTSLNRIIKKLQYIYTIEHCTDIKNDIMKSSTNGFN